MNWRTVAVALTGIALLGACKPGDNQSTPDIVIGTETSRSGANEEHYAQCATDPNADIGDYRVLIPAGMDDGGLPEGAPCPAGPRELVPPDAHPELYAELSDALHAPAPYRGGDETCSWEADTAEDAQLMAESCAEER